MPKPTAPPATFAATLRRHRAAAGLTQQALAVAAGLSVAIVRSLEQGLHEPKWGTVQKLADALGLATDELRAG